MLATTLTAALVLCATPSPFVAFAKTFPALTLPATLPSEGKPLQGTDVMTFVMEPLAGILGPSPTNVAPRKSALAAFARDGQPGQRAETLKAMADPKAEGALIISAVGRVMLPGAVGLVVRRQQAFPMGTEDQTVLLTFSGEGTFRDGLVLADTTSTEAGSVSEQATLGADFTVTIAGQTTVPVHDVEGLTQLDGRVTATWSVTPRGVCVEKGSAWAGVEGWYEDPKSHEQLLLKEEKGAVVAWYRNKPEGKPQKLTVARRDAGKREVVVRFGKSPKDYVVTSPDGFAALACRNPDGTVQQFQRTR